VIRLSAASAVRFLLALCALAPLVAAAQQCTFTQPAPPNWQRVDTAVVRLALPRDAYRTEDSRDDASGYRYRAEGLDVLVDYGLARAPAEPETGMVSRLLGGAPAFIVSEARADGAGRIAITWTGLGHTQSEASVTIAFADAARRNDACRIASALRLLGDAATLTLLRTGSSAGQRYAVLRSGNGEQRRVVEGDYVALNWGQVAHIEERAVEIAERLPARGGGWSERRTTLRATH
jgi:hypothetical protein